MAELKKPVVLASALIDAATKKAVAEAEAAAAKNTPQLPAAYLFKPVVVPQIRAGGGGGYGDPKASSKRRRVQFKPQLVEYSDEDGEKEEDDDDETQEQRVAKLLAPDDIDLPNGKKGRLVPLRSYAKFKDAKEIDDKGRVTSTVWRCCTLQCRVNNVWKPLTLEHFWKSPQNYSGLDQRCKVCRNAEQQNYRKKAVPEKATENKKKKKKTAQTAKTKVKARDSPSPSLIDGVDEGEEEEDEEELVKLPNGGTGQLIDVGRSKCQDCKEFGTGVMWRKCEYQYCKAMGNRAWKPLNNDNFQRTRNAWKTTCRRCIQKFNRGDLEPDSVDDSDGKQVTSSLSLRDSAVMYMEISPSSAAAASPAAAAAPVSVAAMTPIIPKTDVPMRLSAAIEAEDAKVQARIKQLQSETTAEMQAVQAAAERLKKSREQLKVAEAERDKFKDFEDRISKTLGLSLPLSVSAPVPMDTSSS
jgi:hypothetical protein